MELVKNRLKQFNLVKPVFTNSRSGVAAKVSQFSAQGRVKIGSCLVLSNRQSKRDVVAVFILQGGMV